MPADKATVAKKYSALKNRISVKTEFYSDIALKNTLYAVTIRSPIDRGIITSIFQETLPDGYSLFTARDVPGSNLLETPQGKISIFSAGNISYKGEPIGILTGPDERILLKIKDSLQINYDSNTIEDYLELENGEGTPDFATPTSTTRTLIRGKDADHIEDIFSSAQYVAEHEWEYNVNTPYYREPQGAVANFDGEHLTIYTPTQWISNLRNALCQATHIDTDNIIINKTKSYDTSTNSIWYNSVIACQVAVAAFHTKCPVKLVYSRQEQECFIDSGMPVHFKYKTAADKDGKLLAVKADISLDTGSSNIFSSEIADRLAIAACGCYNAENLDITVTAQHSRKPPLSIDLQLMDSAAFFASENQINCMSEISGISPLEIRKINIQDSPTADADKEEQAAQVYPGFFFVPKAKETIDALVNSSSFGRKYAAYKLNSIARIRKGRNEFIASPHNAPLRGIGVACGFEGSFYYGSEIYGSEQNMEVTLEGNGTLTIHCSPISKTIQDIWVHTAADILGIQTSSIKINSNFETDNEPLLPESAHANISIMTGLLKKCCESIKRRKEGSELPYTVKKKLTSVQKKGWDTTTFTGEPFHRSAFAIAFVEIEFDPCTFREHIREITVVINGGKILNSVAAENSIRLGIEKVLKSLVEEDSIECPVINISFLASEEEPSEIGELVYQVLPAAYTQAISQAIGKTINQIPIKTDTLYGIISSAYQDDSEVEEHADSI